MTWIGLVAPAGAGKDYLYDRMASWSPQFVRVSFADGVRLEIENVLGEGSTLRALWEKPYPDEVRRLLQWWGTEYRRAQDSNYWINVGIARAVVYDNAGKIPVFTDVRFKNEAEAIRAAGGTLVGIHASDETRKARLGGILPPTHVSELQLQEIEVDHHIDGDIDGAEIEYEWMVEELLVRIGLN